MSNPCQCHIWHADLNTITESAESDDKKHQMFEDLTRCTCCAENRMLRSKLVQYEATISNLESFVNTMISKQESIFLQLQKLRQFANSKEEDEEECPEDVPQDNPGESVDESQESLANGDSEDEQWQLPFICMCMPSISQPASVAALSQPSSESDGERFEPLYRPSDSDSDAN